MNTTSVPSIIRWRIRKRFHPLVRVGWAATRSSSTPTQTVFGIALILIGWRSKRSSKRVKLYGYTARPGETVRIRVLQGTTALADTTLEV